MSYRTHTIKSTIIFSKVQNIFNGFPLIKELSLSFIKNLKELINIYIYIY